MPLEFARHSAADKPVREQYVSLVIVDGAVAVPSLWAEMSPHGETAASAVGYAVERLRVRERIGLANVDRWIGRWPSRDQYEFSSTIEAWAVSMALDGVIWTALPPKWDESDGSFPTQEQVIEKLSYLTARGAVYARKYVMKAPRQIQTAYRPAIEIAVR